MACITNKPWGREHTQHKAPLPKKTGTHEQLARPVVLAPSLHEHFEAHSWRAALITPPVCCASVHALRQPPVQLRLRLLRLRLLRLRLLV
jgi:hypothetical protein